MRLSSSGNHFTAESTEAMRIKCLAQGHSILMPGSSTSVFRNQHSNHTTNLLLTYICNLSFFTGVFPNAMKIGKVIPMHKDGQNINLIIIDPFPYQFKKY